MLRPYSEVNILQKIRKKSRRLDQKRALKIAFLIKIPYFSAKLFYILWYQKVVEKLNKMHLFQFYGNSILVFVFCRLP